MPNRKRLMIEIAVVLLLVLIGFAVWSSAQRELAQQRAEHESAAAQVRQECEERVERLAMSEATAVFRAFAAGIQGSALGQQRPMLDLAKGGLLRLPHVAFVHVLAPDGKVLMSSNEKYSVAGSADGRASWALQADNLRTRPGDLPGTVEIAAPFQGASGRVAVLWMGYKTRELLAPAAKEENGSG
jgi:hypothetical protein